MNGEQTARNQASKDAGALFCEPCNRHHFQGEGESGCTHPAELAALPSGLSAIMHDAHTHPRRHDPISLGENLDGPELGAFAAETVTAMDQLASSRLARSSGGVLSIDPGIGETIPATVLDYRTEAEAHQNPGSELACPGFGPGAKGPRCCDLAGEPGICGDCHCACHAGKSDAT